MTPLTPELESALGRAMTAHAISEGHVGELPKSPRSLFKTDAKTAILDYVTEAGPDGCKIDQIVVGLKLANSTVRNHLYTLRVEQAIKNKYKGKCLIWSAVTK